MLVIRAEQMSRLAGVSFTQHVAKMCSTLRAEFGAGIANNDDHAFSEQVEQAIETAQRLGISAPADCLVYLRLAIELGWDFFQRPENEWMLAFLADPQVHAASQRLQRLVEELRYRSRVAAQDRALLEEFFGADEAAA